MSGPLDPNDAFWTAMRQQPGFISAWNSALWEARKLIGDNTLSREDIIAALNSITIHGPRHYKGDDCTENDLNHHIALEAWYARAQDLFDKKT